MATNENLPPNVIKQLVMELKSFDETPPEGIKVSVNEDDFLMIFADIEGPARTPYENGVFHMKLILAHDFPRSPPKGYFLTKIFHPIISSHGEICVNTLKRTGIQVLDYDMFLLFLFGGIPHLLSSTVQFVVRCLLIEPFPESALNEQAGKMLIENYEEYAKHARLYTGIHAKPKLKAKSSGISESTTGLTVGQPKASLVSADQWGTSTSPSLLVTLTTNASTIPAPLLKKDTAGPVKIAADSKKVDARKKSLRRL